MVEARGQQTQANKVFIASWLESEMWINPWLLLVGVTTGILAVAIFVTYPRLAGTAWRMERSRR